MKKLLFFAFFFFLFSQNILYGCAACQLMTPTAEIKLHLNIEDKIVQKIHADWIFSDTYTSSLLVQYDANRDGILNTKEMQDVKKAMLDYLLENNMLTQVRFAKNANNDEALTLTPKFTNFSLEQKESILYFSYDINLDLALQNDALLSLVFSDNNGFFAFVVTDLFIDSQEFYYEKNLYLFTASIVFKDHLIEPQELPKQTQTQQTKEIMQTKETNTSASLQSNLLQESITKIKSLFESIKDEKNPLGYLSLLLFAYIYGLIHAIGPGHGKTLVASYFLSNERSYLKALFVSLAIGVVHTFSAFLLTLFIYYSVDTFLSQFMKDTVYITTKISAVTIIAIALYLFYTKYKAYKKNASAKVFNFATSPHASTCGCGSCKVDKNSTDFALIVSAGIIPCPGTISIFIFSLSLGLYYAGFLAAFVMSIGMSSIIFISAIISVILRKKTLNKNENLKKYLEYASLSVILILGMVLLVT